MRRYAPVIFAVLSALFLVERAISGGAFAAHQPTVVGLGPVQPLGAGAECLPRDEVLATLRLTGARLSPEEAPFCTDRTDIAEWVLAEEQGGDRHLAFDGQGCLAVWQAVTTCP